ncbi:MAG TPA: hypothetical protein VKZ53_08405 [Candidatus Angelobacter sp.]|nr:hypothetical protein [Candidatus Angelobacter sp.]
MTKNRIDDEICRAWLEASKDLGIRVVTPFLLEVAPGEIVTYEAHILDFGGQKGRLPELLATIQTFANNKATIHQI